MLVYPLKMPKGYADILKRIEKEISTIKSSFKKFIMLARIKETYLTWESLQGILKFIWGQEILIQLN